MKFEGSKCRYHCARFSLICNLQNLIKFNSSLSLSFSPPTPLSHALSLSLSLCFLPVCPAQLRKSPAHPETVLILDTTLEEALWEKGKKSRCGSRDLMIQMIPGSLKIWGPEKQTTVGKYLAPDLCFGFITSRSSEQRSDLSLTMYSPQSLHRWGITHSESMERLAYSQGRPGKLNQFHYCLNGCTTASRQDCE